MTAFILTADQEVTVAVAYEDDHGNPAVVNGAPVWASSDDTVLTVTASADGMSALVSTVGPDGAAQVSVTANADMDATGAVVPVVGTMDVQVVSGDAFAGVLTPGTPTLKAP